MTWVVAASQIWGYGALFSDVQVEFADGTYADILQKGYPLGNFIAGGFAGSVRIGFMLLQSLKDELSFERVARDYPDYFRDHPDHLHIWDPVPIAMAWAPTAKRLFEGAPAGERKLQSHILLVGASPRNSQPIGTKIYFVRMASPAFEPQIMSRPIKICGIGTGAGVRQYKHIIKPLLRVSSGLMKAEIGRDGGWGTHLGHSIATTLREHPRPGISRYLNTILVTKTGFMFRSTDQTHYLADGTEVKHHMPPVARSYKEFMAMSRAAGRAATCAVC